MASSAVQGVRNRTSEDPSLPLKMVIVAAGFALTVVFGVVLPGVLGVLLPIK